MSDRAPPPPPLAAGGAAGLMSWRVLGTLNLYRIVVAAGLLVLFMTSGSPRAVGDLHPQLFQWTAIAYLSFATLNTLPLWAQRPAAFVQLCVQVAVDVVALCLLMHASGGIGSGLALLLVVPVGAAALVVATRIGLLFAALAAIAVLLEQSVSQLDGTTAPTDFTAAGLLGAVLFVVALAVYPYARRLAESEALAEQRGIDLRNLSELSEYIVRQLRESIVVVDADGVIRLMNASAAEHLGAAEPRPGRRLADVNPELDRIIRQWRAGDRASSAAAPLLSADGSTEIVPRIAPMAQHLDGPLLVFLEDPGHIAERVQQMKLASLGRLSASIAHEIRNPVGAMSHAAQLLAESPNLTDDDRRLSSIITTHAGRVSGIIDNVLTMSRRSRSRPESLALVDWLERFATEYCATNELPEVAVRVVTQGPDVDVRMDPDQLQQVLWNLCDNAVRYASEDAGTIAVELDAGRLSPGNRPYLDVADRGPGVDRAVLERMFEPFVTGSRGGSGLGLYIARELCEANGAALRYLPRAGGGSVFRVVFADPERWEISAEDQATVGA